MMKIRHLPKGLLVLTGLVSLAFAAVAYASAGNRNHGEIPGLQGRCEICHDHTDTKHFKLFPKDDCGLCHADKAKKQEPAEKKAEPVKETPKAEAKTEAKVEAKAAKPAKAAKARKAAQVEEKAAEPAKPEEPAQPAKAEEPARPVEAQKPVADGPLEKVGKDTCLNCHDGYLANTVHGRLPKKLSESGKMECESCHGLGSAHVAGEGDTSKITRRPAPETVKAMCANCHPRDRADKAAWTRGVHNAQAESDCLTCHDFHKNDIPAQLRKPVIPTCLACHPEVKAEFARPYHHPLAEGQLTCASCHDPHTQSAGLDRPDKINALCVSCHSEVRGPFMWEHKALKEEKGCLNCHQAHGGSSRKLLKQSDNPLCIACHQQQLQMSAYIDPTKAGTASKAGIEHSRMPALQGRCASCHGAVFNPMVGLHTNAPGITNADCGLCHANIQGIDHTKFLTKGRCMDCHTDIHGSNHSREFLD